MTDENLTLDDIEQDLINQVYSLDADDPKTTIAIENLKTIHQINEKPDPVSRRLVPSGALDYRCSLFDRRHPDRA